MKLRYASFLLSGSLAACAHAPERDRDLQAAKALFQQNIEAIQKRDRERYLACYRQDAELIRNGPSGPAFGFEEIAADTSTVPESWPDSLAASDVQLRWLGPGYVYGSYRYRVVYAGAAFEGISERVFAERDGRWQILVTTAFGDPASSDARLSAVAFLSGHWSYSEGERTAEETWSHARGGTMLGAARLFIGDRTEAYEHLRIELEGDRIFLIAAPGGQAVTRFALTERAPERVLFENPEHDFPQRIVYRRDGDRLHVRIEGSGRSMEWVYERR